jgi:UDP-N-acetylmuramyl pentapeptide phosphotransferase/UDP-N-acetylglucosamine-1-phosphate transferase
MTEVLLPAFITACLAATLGTWLILRSRLAMQALDRVDKPNAMHAVAVPRIGGLSLMVAAALSYLILTNVIAMPPLLATIFLVALTLSALSLKDDLRGLTPIVRLLAHLAAALIVVAFSSQAVLPSNQVVPGTSLISVTLAVIAVAWMTNLYNFMDGANGLAGLMGMIGFAAMAWVAADHAQLELARLSMVIAGACSGFLFFNFPRPRVFLGDVGSIPLGFLAASLGLYGYQHGVWTWAFPLLVFSPFVVDATVTLAKRIAAGARIWEAHRQHYYHRLILDCGWSHTRTALVYAALMVATSGYSLMLLPTRLGDGENAREIGDVLLYLAPWAVIYASLIAALEWRLRSARLRKNRA